MEVTNTKVKISWHNANNQNLLHIATEKNLPRTLDMLLAQAQREKVLSRLAAEHDNSGFAPYHYAARKLSARWAGKQRFKKYSTHPSSDVWRYS